MMKGEGDGDDSAVVGLALRFALSARPTGSQGFAPGKANDEDKNKTKSKNKSKSKDNNRDQQKRGHF
jgi:hypothetical protein